MLLQSKLMSESSEKEHLGFCKFFKLQIGSNVLQLDPLSWFGKSIAAAKLTLSHSMAKSKDFEGVQPKWAQNG